MRAAGILLFAVTACTTTTGVQSSKLGRLGGASGADAYFVTGDDGGRLRIDPNTNIRFERTNGKFTPWVRARHLYTNRHGVFRIHRLPLSEARRVEVHGVSDDVLSLMKACVPVRSRHTYEAGVFRVFGPPGGVADWVRSYLARRSSLAIRVSDDWRDEQEGRFRFGYGFGGWSRPIDGRGLVTALEDGLDVELGLAFRDIGGAEVRNFSGSKSLALVVGSAAVVAAIVAAAKGDVGTTHAPLHVGEAAIRTVAYVAYCGEFCGGRTPRLPTGALGSVQTSSPNAMAAQRLFDKGARRRADLKIIASAEGGFDLTGTRGFSQTAAVTARLRDFFEIGGGARRTLSADRQTPHYLAFARAGGTFHLDEARRIGVAILGDIGGGSNVMQAKLNLGLRVRVLEKLNIGAFLFSPTYTVEGRGPDDFSDWSFPSGLELAYAF